MRETHSLTRRWYCRVVRCGQARMRLGKSQSRSARSVFLIQALRISRAAGVISKRTGAPVFFWCCQTNANQSQFAEERRISGRAKLTPFGKRGGSVELEDASAGEAAFVVEVVVDGGVNSGEFLQTSHAPEPKHRPLASSQWQV